MSKPKIYIKSFLFTTTSGLIDLTDLPQMQPYKIRILNLIVQNDNPGSFLLTSQLFNSPIYGELSKLLFPMEATYDNQPLIKNFAYSITTAAAIANFRFTFSLEFHCPEPE